MKHVARLVGISLVALAASTSAMAQDTPPAGSTAPNGDQTQSSTVGRDTAQPGPASTRVDEPVSNVATAQGDIIVTATKREQNLSEIPAAISALGSGSLQQKAIFNIVDLNATVPGLQISPNNTDISITIRGVGHQLFSPSAENSVALHLDGVYLSRPSAAQSAFFDVDRVEVLRGPQGTLYGRNATGGAVNVISKGPTSEVEGYVSVGVANYQRIDVEGAIGGPIIADVLSARVGAFMHKRNNGFGRNLATGDKVDDLDEYGGKASIKAKLSDKLSVTVRGDYYYAKDNFGEYHAFGPVRQPFPGAQPLAELLGGTRAPNIRDTNFDAVNFRRSELWGVSGEINYEFSDAVSVRSLTAFRHTEAFYQTDLDGTQLPVFSPFRIGSDTDQFSQELQLNLDLGDVYAIIGAYYFDETVDSDNRISSYLATGLPAFGIPRILPAPFGVFEQIASLKTDAEAVFANVDWNVTDRLTLGGGLRYSTEKKGNVGYDIAFFPNFVTYPGVGFDVVDDSRRSSGVTPRGTAKYAITDDINIYASVSRGFKSGEWISGTNQYAEPERVWAYETGLKGSLFDRTINFAFSAFYYDYTNLQVQRVQTPIVVLENSPGGTLKGIEGEGSIRLPAGFSLDGNFTYLDTKIEGFITQDPNLPGSPTRDLTGNRFAFAPKFTYNVGVEKRTDFGDGGVGVARFDLQHSSGTFLDLFNRTDNAFRKPYTVLNASYKHTLAEGLSLLVWGKNLTDRTIRLYELANQIPNLIIRTPTGAPVPVASTAVGSLNEPRTYGATLRFDF